MFQMIDNSERRTEGKPRETFRTQIRPVPTPRPALRATSVTPPRVWPIQVIVGLAIAAGGLTFVHAVWSTITFFTRAW